jgi:lipopolysaccharide export system protein LptA
MITRGAAMRQLLAWGVGSSLAFTSLSALAQKRAASPAKAPVPAPPLTETSGTETGIIPMSNGPTVIDADYANIEKASGIAVFSGNVGLKHPQFRLKCDKLTIWIKREAETGPGRDKEKEKESTSSVGRLDKAVATGSVEIIQDKVDESGQPQRNIGRGREALFESSTGDLTLKGMPEVEADGNLVKATEDRCVIILNQKQTMRVLGRHSMLLRGS